MKLKKEYNYIIEMFKKINPEKLYNYAIELKKSKNYNNFEIRLCWDIARACIPCEVLCSFYDKYNCNDSHKTTIFKKAMHEVFPDVKNLI